MHFAFKIRKFSHSRWLRHFFNYLPSFFLFTLLLCLYASRPYSAFAFDLNDDGYADLVIANYSENDNYNLPSYVYLGKQEGNFVIGEEIPTSGARGISVMDMNQDEHPDLIVSNYSNGTARNIPSYIFWNDGQGKFTHKTALPTVSAFGHSVADLNRDGYLDIVFSNYSDGDHAAIHSYLYWGDKDYTFSNQLKLATHAALGNAITDLNRDGYLDILFCSNNTEETSAPSYVYWGSADARFTKRMELPTRYAYDVTAADLNQDGWIDLVFSEFSDDPSSVWWGSKALDFKKRTLLKTDHATSNTAADIDQDGYLDIVFSCHRKGAEQFETDSLIYWGSKKRPFQKSTRLATNGAHGNSIGDLNQDGRPDIVFANRYGPDSFIYFNQGRRQFTQKKLPSIGSTGVAAGDEYAYGQSVLKKSISPALKPVS